MSEEPERQPLLNNEQDSLYTAVFAAPPKEEDTSPKRLFVDLLIDSIPGEPR